MSVSNKIHQIVNELSQALHTEELIVTPSLISKLNKAAQSYPHDKTIGMVLRVVQDLNNNKQNLYIRRADLKKLYQQYQTFGTKFAELFQDELGQLPAEPSITTLPHEESVKSANYEVKDHLLANALASAFDKNTPIKLYSQPLANKALKAVSSTLDAWNLKPTQLSVGDGNERFIIIKADYETPKGITSFYVPVEINKNNIINPEVFMGHTGPQDLNHLAIKGYVTQYAGIKNKIGASDVLQVLYAAIIDNREVNDVDLAIIKLNASRHENSEFSQNQVLGLKVEASVSEVKSPRTEESFSFEKEFNSPKGQASWQFGQEKVNTAREHILRELSSFGFKNAQVAVSGYDKQTINFGVALDTGKVAFTVPVKVVDKKIQKPTVILCSGNLTTFDKTGINSLVSQNKIDIKAAAVASAMSSLKPSEIINNLREAVATGNHAKTEDALNVLANSNDPKAFETGFNIYLNALSNQEETITKCAKMIDSKISEYPICSHTGLPINKVYQDKNGYCHPLYRKGMDETYEGASFINAKIFG